MFEQVGCCIRKVGSMFGKYLKGGVSNGRCTLHALSLPRDTNQIVLGNLINSKSCNTNVNTNAKECLDSVDEQLLSNESEKSFKTTLDTSMTVNETTEPTNQHEINSSGITNQSLCNETKEDKLNVVRTNSSSDEEEKKLVIDDESYSLVQKAN